MSGKLFICASPIGNLEDVSLRLMRVLAEVDVIAAEDTRTTRKLLERHGIKNRLVSYHDHNERAMAPRLIQRLHRGENVALISESGAPAISDPGHVLIRTCIEEGLDLEVIPGPTAVIAALILSGLPSSRFSFEGFLPKGPGARRRRLARIRGDDRTLVFFEAPGRVARLLREIREILGERRAALVREMTKVHEQTIRGTVSSLLEEIPSEVRGEIAIVVEAAPDQSGDLEAAIQKAHSLVAAGDPKSKAASAASSEFNVPKRRVYERLLEL